MAGPRILWDAKGKTREEWLEVRAHGPKGELDYTLGGSDIPIIFGLSPWTTALELWHLKKGNIKPAPSANEDAMEMGHMMEPIIGYFYQKRTGNEEIEDTYMYQHATRDYAIADLDGRFRDKKSGEIGIVEKKFITYRKGKDWDDDAIPPMYEMQGRWYMSVVELGMTDFAAMWGNNTESDMAIPRIHRDAGSEAMVFDRADAFIDSLRRNDPPKVGDVQNTKQALQALARIYGASISGLPTVEFTAKFEKHIRKITEMQEEIAELDKRKKRCAEIIEAQSVPLAEAMKQHDHGELLTSKERFIIHFPTKTTRRTSTKILKEKHPDVYEDVLTVSESRKIKIEREAL